MNSFLEILYIGFLALDLMLAVSSRLLHCIRLIAMQGLLLGLLSLCLSCTGEEPHTAGIILAVINLIMKGIVIPMFLERVMRKIDIKRELEPLLGYSASCIIALAMIGTSYLICRKIPIGVTKAAEISVSVAFSTMLIGLFLIISRRKAIMQAMGFLVFENGITLFGNCMSVEYSAPIELCILLDVLVLVFIMGIAMYHIKSEFHHIDTDKLNHLGDNQKIAEETANDTEEDD